MTAPSILLSVQYHEPNMLQTARTPFRPASLSPPASNSERLGDTFTPSSSSLSLHLHLHFHGERLRTFTVSGCALGLCGLLWLDFAARSYVHHLHSFSPSLHWQFHLSLCQLLIERSFVGLKDCQYQDDKCKQKQPW